MGWGPAPPAPRRPTGQGGGAIRRARTATADGWRVDRAWRGIVTCRCGQAQRWSAHAPMKQGEPLATVATGPTERAAQRRREGAACAAGVVAKRPGARRAAGSTYD